MKQDNQTYGRIDKGWNKMEAILDQKMPQRKRRYAFVWWFIFAVLALILVTHKLKDFGTGMGIQNIPQKAETNSGYESSETELARTSAQSAIQIDKDPSELSDIQSIQIAGGNNLSMNSGSTIRKENNAQSFQPAESKNAAGQSGIIDVNNSGPGDFTLLDPYSQEDVSKNIEIVKLESIYRLQPVDLQKPEHLSTLREAAFAPAIDIQKAKINHPLHLGLSIGAERLTDFRSNGLGIGIFAEKEISNRLGVGLEMGVNWNKNQSQRDTTLVESADVPGQEEDLNLGQGSIFQGDTLQYLLSVNNNYNSAGLQMYVYYYPIQKLQLYTGLSYRRFFNVHELKSDPRANAGLSPGNVETDELAKSYTFAMVGLQYRLAGRFSVFAQYDRALSNYYEQGTRMTAPNRIYTGVSIMF